MITSTGNAQVREVVQLIHKRAYRQAQRAFVIEGIRSLKEAPKGLLRQVFVTEAFLSRCAPEDGAFVQALPCGKEMVSDEVMQRLSDTRTPQGILGVVSAPAWETEDLFDGASRPLLLVLENLQDPGNVGTIFRSAEGAGVTGILLVGDTADPFNPKVVRGTMGSIFRMPFLQFHDIRDAAALLSARDVITYAAAPEGARSYDTWDYKLPTAFLIGNEGNGLSAEAMKTADRRVYIPMAGRLESLNAAVSAAILSFEASRQRRLS